VFSQDYWVKEQCDDASRDPKMTMF
jgi:hypothetical protein